MKIDKLFCPLCGVEVPASDREFEDYRDDEYGFTGVRMLMNFDNAMCPGCSRPIAADIYAYDEPWPKQACGEETTPGVAGEPQS